jgi:hypothetical protein
MTDKVVFIGGGTPAHEVAGELAERIKALVYEYGGRMPLATAVGVLEIAKMEILQEDRG